MNCGFFAGMVVMLVSCKAGPSWTQRFEHFGLKESKQTKAALSNRRSSITELEAGGALLYDSLFRNLSGESTVLLAKISIVEPGLKKDFILSYVRGLKSATGTSPKLTISPLQRRKFESLSEKIGRSLDAKGELDGYLGAALKGSATDRILGARLGFLKTSKDPSFRERLSSWIQRWPKDRLSADEEIIRNDLCETLKARRGK